MEPTFLIAILSIVVGAIIILVVFRNYFGKTRSEIDSLANTKEIVDSKPTSEPQHKKFNSKAHSHASHAADKVYITLFCVCVWFGFTVLIDGELNWTVCLMYMYVRMYVYISVFECVCLMLNYRVLFVCDWFSAFWFI